jgi:hypothetical protein
MRFSSSMPAPQALLEVARDPDHLGAEIGFLSILHTWSSNLLVHYHIHAVVPAGGLSADHQRWISTSHPMFLLPVPALSVAFRDKFLAGLRHLYQRHVLTCRGPAAHFSDRAWFEKLLEELGNKRWYVYAQPPFGGPQHVLRYLGRYTHRMAISNHRLAAFDGERVRTGRIPSESRTAMTGGLDTAAPIPATRESSSTCSPFTSARIRPVSSRQTILCALSISRSKQSKKSCLKIPRTPRDFPCRIPRSNTTTFRPVT